MRSPDNSPALILNADFRPLSYFPLSTLRWQDAVKAVFLDRVNIVAHYDRYVSSPSFEMQLPSVIALKEYISPQHKPAFSRFNVFLRDDFTCQYTGEKHPVSDLTFDHVIPRSKGGKTSWDNIVTASRQANNKKGDKSLQECGMKLLKKPFEPSAFQLHEMGKKYPPQFLHETWEDFLYWDGELDQ